MAQNSLLLKKFITQYPFIEAIVLSDKDCVQISSAFNSENSLMKDNSISLMFVAAITQHNDNLSKSLHTKTKALTLIYDEHLAYFEVWQNVILCMYCSPDANLGSLKGVAQELNQFFAKQYNELIEKQAQINK